MNPNSIPASTELAAIPDGIEEIVDLAQTAVAPFEVSVGTVAHRLVPDGMTAQLVTFPESELPAPRRKRGTVQAFDVESLCAYVDRHHRHDGTTVWIDDITGQVTAVLDDHETNDVRTDEEGAQWGEHRAVLQLRHTVEWEHWARLDGELVEQQQFAEHIDQGLLEVVEPDGATLLEIAQTFHATTEAKFRSAMRLQDGNVQFQYDEEANAAAGRAGELQIPATFSLLIAPYLGEDPQPMDADLRYRVRNGDLRIGYQLRRPHEVLRRSLEQLAQRLSEKYAVLRGTPRTA